MYTAKHAMLYKHKVHHGTAYVFYMDIRSPGKGYDEFDFKRIVRALSDFANVELSARNIPYVKVLKSEGVNVYDVMKYRNMLITADAVSKLEGVLA